MGQQPPTLPGSLRIKPCPGSSGLNLNRRGVISVYSEISNTIYNIKPTQSTTVSQILSHLPSEKFDLKLDQQILPPSTNIQSLNLPRNALLKLVPTDKTSEKSTLDSLDLTISRGVIGPRPNYNQTPDQPKYQTTLISQQDSYFSPIQFSVPDVQISKQPKPKKSLY